MADNLKKSSQKVQDALDQFGLNMDVLELPESTRTAKEAAKAIGCQVGQIAKSLIFKTVRTERPILVIASGVNRVNVEKISNHIGEQITKADAKFVRQQTGYVIGGVPPVGHKKKIDTYLDEDLIQHRQIWAAAGTPFAVFELTGDNLIKITGGQILNIKGITRD